MKNLMLILVFTVSVLASYGQPPHRDGISKEKRQKLESMKVAFITQRLDLTPDEAKVFWPVYNQMSDELHGLREKRRTDMKNLRSASDSLSDKDYEKIFDSDLQFRQAEIDILKKYQPQLKKVLPMKKLAKLPRVEDDFRQELLEKLKERDGKGPGPKGHGGKRP